MPLPVASEWAVVRKFVVGRRLPARSFVHHVHSLKALTSMKTLLRLSLFLFLLCPFPFMSPRVASAQDWLSATAHANHGGSTAFRLLTYNVENLFDTIDNPLTLDDDFLPQGPCAWTRRRFSQKLHGIARVVLDAGGLEPIDVVGLCEVEGDSVLEALVRHTRLARLGYEYVCASGADARGINVALLYHPLTFRLISHRSLRVSLPRAAARPTRDVLLCTGVTLRGDTLDVLQVHFPSRRGGSARSHPFRQAAVQTVVAAADSLRRVRQRCRIVVMGDMNAEADDSALLPLRQAGFTLLSPTVDRTSGAGGSYFYRGAWSNIDHCLVGGAFRAASSQIFVRDYLLESPAPGLYKPRRTFLGTVWHGGLSDHLPVLTTLQF